MRKDKYEVEYKVKGLYENGRYFPKKVLHEKATFSRLKNRGILRGASAFKGHLKAVFGSNLKLFKIRRIK